MSPAAAIVLSLGLAALVVAALSKPGKNLVGGISPRDHKGRMTLVLTPTRKPKRRKGRRSK